MRKSIPFTILILTFLSRQAMAQCHVNIGTSGTSCIGSTISTNLTGAVQVQWKRDGQTVKTVNGLWTAFSGYTIAGSKYGSAGFDATHLYTPYGLYLDAAGNVYVADSGSNRVKKWAPGAVNGSIVAGNRNGFLGSDSNFLWAPTSVSVDAGNNVYVVDQQNHRVQKWNNGVMFGTTVAGQKSGGSSAFGKDSAHLWSPTAIYVDAGGNIYVADGLNNRVQKWNRGATFGITVAGKKDGTPGGDSTHLNYPNGVVVDVLGNVYVSDARNNRIQKWAPGDTFGTTVAGNKNDTAGSDSAHLNFPAGLYLDKSAILYIADMGNNRIQKWRLHTSYGTTIAGDSKGTSGTGNALLNQPTAVSLDTTGNIYIADKGNNRVQKWALTIPTGVQSIKADSAGVYSMEVIYNNGCIALSNIIYISAPTYTQLDTTICSNQSLTVKSKAYSVAGTYMDTLVSIYGCDSIVTTRLKVKNTSSTALTATICSGLSYTFNGKSYSATGTYIDTLMNINGCDSMATLNLTVKTINSTTVNAALCSGQSYILKGNTYTTAGTYIDTLLSKAGCDSIVTLNLLYKSSSTNTLTASICSNQVYSFNGKTYSIGGTYIDTLLNSVGCDSIVTLNLSVKDTNNITITKALCAGSAYSFNGKSYTATGMYTDTLSNKAGCDSLVTLNLTIKATSAGTDNGAICSGTPLIYHGKAYNTAGIYTDTLTNTLGCDSIVTLTVINDSVVNTSLNIAICQGESIGLNGKSYSTSGIYSDTLNNLNGCDSIVKLNLTVIGYTFKNYSDTIKPGHTVTINNKVYSKAGYFTDTLRHVTSLCDSVILQITITVASGVGNIAGASPLLNIFPNPSNGQFVIDLVTGNHSAKARIQVIDILGQLTHEQVVDNINGTVHAAFTDNSLPPGMYLVKVQVGSDIYTRQIVVERP